MTGRDEIARVGIAVQAGKPMTVQGNGGRGSQEGRASVAKDWHMRNNNQRGIVIGPILAVVALLAVLAAAISAGSGAFNGDISAVKAKAQASAILGYVNELQIGVDRLLAKGCKDTEISFENRFGDGQTDGLRRDINYSAPSDKSCHVFDINGGGVVWKEPPKGVNIIALGPGSGYWVSDFVPYIIGAYAAIPNLGTNSNELVLYLPISDEKLCLQINKILGTSMLDTYGMYGSPYQVDYFRGAYGQSPYSYSNFIPGEKSGCNHQISNYDSWFPGGLGILYYFYHVLHVR